jgi:glycosyltransferase involved in cell wall biosynthesis
MARVALVSHDVPTIRGRAGGVGAFVAHFSTLLRERGDEVTIVLTRQETEPTRIDAKWREIYAARGIGLVEIHNTPPSADRWSDAWTSRLSEHVAPLLRGFDVAYFQDWANVAFQAARAKRFAPAGWPELVTVLHGPSAWIRAGNQAYPKIPEDLHLEYIERYSARYSDRVIAPSRYILDWVRRDGWTFSNEPEVLGLPFLPSHDDGEPATATNLRQIVFFGRLETRKGFSLFVNALRRLREPLGGQERVGLERVGLEQVVLLGHEDEPGAVDRVRRELGEIPVIHIGNLDSDGAMEYLRQHRSDSLVVIPSPAENFPYAVIETSLIPGLRTLCSSGGGVPEIFAGAAAEQLFEPHADALADKLAECWRSPGAVQPSYDYRSANRRWLEFHERALQRPRTMVAVSRPDARAVDVCITYFNKASHFPELLEALAAQTVQGFGVIAVDDGSTEPEAQAVFDAMAARYADRGWTFFRQANVWVDAARNAAAKRSQAEYLLFIDADDVPAPSTVERLLSAALISGDDCLLSGGLLIEDGSVQARYMPLGPNLTSGLIDPGVFGMSMILIRRAVFESLGGYRTIRGAAHEDWELLVRLELRGYRADVVPEFLLHFRRLPDGLARNSDDFAAKRRLIETYQEAFAQLGMHGMANTIHALYRRCQELEKAAREQVPPEVRTRLHERVREILARKTQA